MRWNPPVLQTARLTLRPPVQEDFPFWSALMADPVASRFIGGPQLPAVAWRGMATMTGSWVLEGFGMFSIIERTTGKWLGRAGPWQPMDWPGPEIGYALARDAWGNGYALEAATTAIGWALEQLGWTEFIHIIDPENTASIRLATRLGSVRRGPGRVPPPFENDEVEIWGQTASQWQQRRDLNITP
jgi:RimJ/RimL family protein N-acetyltransferase